ncbi:MAG: hypothetical protein ACUVWB_08360 [Anaerolineae bacterium]
MWIWQAFTGALLTVLLVAHMVANHYVVEGGLRSYADVIHYLSNPFIFALESVFLAVVTAHALMGVRAIVLDLGISPAADRRLKIALTIIGLAAVLYALWLTAGAIARA